MSPDQIQAVRERLQRQLADQVAQAIGEFQDATGIGVVDVEVRLADASDYQDRSRRAVVEDVRFVLAIH